VIEKWRAELVLRIYDPYPDVLLQFPTSFTSVDAEPAYHRKGSLRWHIVADDTIEVYFLVEKEPLFKYLERHLPSKQMWEDFRCLKQGLAEAIKRAAYGSRISAQGAALLATRIVGELDKVLDRRRLTGKCQVCRDA
jgi:hypothetical protein